MRDVAVERCVPYLKNEAFFRSHLHIIEPPPPRKSKSEVIPTFKDVLSHVLKKKKEYYFSFYCIAHS